MIASLIVLTWAIPATGDVVSATRVGPYLQVRAFVNDTPLNLIVDTGAGLTVLTTKAAQAASVNGGVPVRAVGAGAGAVTATLAKVDTLRIGSSTVNGEQVAVLDLPAELACDGLVGYSFLKHFVTTIDYGAPSLTFTNPASFRPHAADGVLDMVIKGNHPNVRASVAGHEGMFLLDTGASGALTLYSSFVKSGQFGTKFPPRLSRISGKGVGGFVRGDITTLPGLEIAGTKLEEVPTIYSTTASRGESTDNAGAIGASIIQKFIMTLDYGGGRVYFRKSSLFDVPYDVDRSGVFLNFTDGRCWVVEVVKGSPADVAGVRTDDEVISVQGAPLSSQHPMKVRAALRAKAGSKVSLSLMREGKPVKTEIVLRDL